MILPESGTLMTTVVCAECKCIITEDGLCLDGCKYNCEINKQRPKEIWTWKLEKVEPFK